MGLLWTALHHQRPITNSLWKREREKLLFRQSLGSWHVTWPHVKALVLWVPSKSCIIQYCFLEGQKLFHLVRFSASTKITRWNTAPWIKYDSGQLLNASTEAFNNWPESRAVLLWRVTLNWNQIKSTQLQWSRVEFHCRSEQCDDTWETIFHLWNLLTLWSVDYSGNVQFPYVILQHYKFNIRVKWPELSDL